MEAKREHLSLTQEQRQPNTNRKEEPILRSKQEILNALDYYSAKLPSAERNENPATIASLKATIETLQWVLKQIDY